ncbi:M1 family metallopeptidase [Ferruginibacter sp. SUN106]|uniref:M1 family metallopeptidase n=1 Tax=Ferruginibacter sp. SUN106 TaxID=2978348 RepID=UPI003D35D20B
MLPLKKIIAVFATLFIISLSIIHLQAQPLKKMAAFTHADTLRGTYGPSRDWWDVLKYDLHVKFNIVDSTISGQNVMSFKVLNTSLEIPNGNHGLAQKRMQIDLQEPMILDGVSIISHIRSSSQTQTAIKYAAEEIKFTRDGNAYFIDWSKQNLKKGEIYTINIFYHGKPRIARRPPWDGGLIWKKSKDGSPWVSIACQGLGASVWYPCKDHQTDEPDSAEMHITCPDSLMCVGNGRYRGKINNGDGTATYDWAVTEPINNYNIIPYIGKYTHFSEVYKGEKGDLDMDYWVLQENLEKAKVHFADAPRMIKAFEHWFGPYPFYADGYKLVDAPHLGMEHQSATAYGNGYQNGYLGRDQSGTGWGLKWDFIIIHESGHEWFANNITSKDIADMWVHEGFTNYSETLFTDFWYGKEAGNAYCIGTRRGIRNDIPIIGPYNVNQEGSGDMYPKSGNMLHSIRQVINDDEKFRMILRGLNKTFYHQTVTTKQIEDYVSKQSKIDFSKVFDQYLRTTMIPVLQYKIEGNKVSYRYDSVVTGFNLPLKVSFGKEDKSEQWIKPTATWQTLSLADWYDKKTFVVNPNFYVKSRKVE